MKLNLRFLNDLYIVHNIREENVNNIMIQIGLDREHILFKGHFPGNPVLPGACTVQILKELLEYYTGSEMHLVKASVIKYLSFLNPYKNSLINYELHLSEAGNDRLVCNATVGFESLVFCSFKGEFVRL